MKKTSLYGIYAFFSAALASAALASAAESKQKGAIESQSITISPLHGRLWVEQCIKKHPEILWLADENVRKTEEGEASLEGSYSEQIFKKKYAEFDRTIMTLRCLHLVLDGSDTAYETFTAAQPEEIKLTRQNFHILHLQGKQLLQSHYEGLSEGQMLEAMATALVLGDLGKSEKAREIFKNYGCNAPDHDDFYGQAIKVINEHPKLSPSFARLSEAAQKLLVKTGHLTHYGHFTHLEGGLEILSPLSKSGLSLNDPDAVHFDLFVHTLDVAGAAGHINQSSSLVYTDLTHKAMQAMKNALRELFNPNKTDWDAYNHYLNTRASWIGLNPDDSSDRVLARIGAMLRLFTQKEGEALKKSMRTFPEEIQDRIAAQLDIKPYADPVRTPTYMPAVLVNLFNNSKLGTSKEERLQQAIVIGLPFIARVLETYRKMLDKQEIDQNVPLNFNPIAGVAKSYPESLINGDFTIDKEGNVRLVSR